ncbi:MAG: hypothetical protein ACHQHO_01125 [Solirubrobacterales bacterium]
MNARLTTGWRSRTNCACAAAVLALSLAGPTMPVALAAVTTSSGAASPGAPKATPEGSNGSAFSELSRGAQETTPTQTETTAPTTAATSNSKKTVLIIIGVALVLLVAIGYVIVRDARRMAPAGDPQVAEARSAHDSAATLRKRRAKAKAARAQRKRNR